MSSRVELIKRRLETYAKNQDHEDEDEGASFFIADIGEVYRLYQRWTKSLPRVHPHFAIKCNPDQEIIRTLASFGAGFDCSSRGEIEKVLNLGIEPSRIVYANSYKSHAHFRFAVRNGVCRMVFDSADELRKIKTICPSAELLLRIMADDSTSACQFNQKFGAQLSSMNVLLEMARDLDLKVVGVSFHVGSNAKDTHPYLQAIQDSRLVFDEAKKLGIKMNILDIGGGFSSKSFESMAQVIEEALDIHFPEQLEIEIIAEPGRFLVETVFTLACNIIGRRESEDDEGKPIYMLYLNDGVYSNFGDSLLSNWEPKPRILLTQSDQPSTSLINYSIWGRTCDGIDRIVRRVSFPNVLNVGDWLYFSNMGAYSACLASSFNGYDVRTPVYYFGSGEDVNGNT
ncbi:MAG: hypothetical protein Q9167_007861 [Letrouitia subvulpina]